MQRLTGLVLFTVLVAGCGGIKIRRIDDAAWFKTVNRNALESDELSDRTSQYLRREGLRKSYRKDPVALIRKLDTRLDTSRTRLLARHLAEHAVPRVVLLVTA